MYPKSPLQCDGDVLTHLAECLSRYVNEGVAPAGLTVGTHARWCVRTPVISVLRKLDKLQSSLFFIGNNARFNRQIITHGVYSMKIQITDRQEQQG